MAEIYDRARRVCVWLGASEENGDIAFLMMQYLADCRPHLDATDYYSDLPREGIEKDALRDLKQRWETCNPRISFEAAIFTFSTIAKKPWFERLWVVQEVLGRLQVTLYQGQHRMTLESTIRAFTAFCRLAKTSELSHFNTSREDQIVKVYDKGYDVTGNTPLLSFLMATSHLKAAEPRDRVFALIALANKNQRHLIKVDYATTLPDIWRQVTRLSLRAPANPAILAIRGTQLETVDRSSSWSPDFSSLTSESHRKYNWYHEQALYCSAGGHSQGSSFLEATGPDVLDVPGVLLGQVQNVLKGSNRPYLPEQASTQEDDMVTNSITLLHWYVDCREFAQDMGFVFEKLWLFTELLCQGIPWSNATRPEGHNSRFRHAFQTALRRHPEYASYSKYVKDVCEDICLYPMPEQHVDCLDRTRLLAAMTDGRLGWVPRDAQPGDHVCLIQGCPAPFIVRERDDGYLAIVGDAFVQGVMSGEAWPKDYELFTKVRVFRFK